MTAIGLIGVNENFSDDYETYPSWRMGEGTVWLPRICGNQVQVALEVQSQLSAADWNLTFVLVKDLERT